MKKENVTSGTPQGACLSPLFFCLYISPVVELLDTYTKEEAEEQKDIPEKHKKKCWKHIFPDDTKLSGSLTEEKDMDSLQKYLDITLNWMEKMGMTVNGDKRYTVRCGPLKQNKTYFAGKEPIKFTPSMRDLGLQFCSDGSYKEQVGIASKKASTTANWVLRVFRNRSIDFFKNMFRSLIQPHLDYGCPVWSPSTQKSITVIGDVLRRFSKRCPGISHLHYWDRLKKLGLNSMERRQERYTILYVFKILRKEVDDPGSFEVKHSIKRGLTLRNTLKMTGKPALRRVIEESFGARAVKLFNSLPRFIREYQGPSSSIKNYLQIYLSEVPDQPRGKSGLHLPQGVIPETGVRSNSLIHWRTFLERTWQDYPWNAQS